MFIYSSLRKLSLAQLLPLVRRRHVFSCGAVLFLSLVLGGCFVPDDKEPEPPRVAGVQVIHQNLQQGEIEVLFDGVQLVSVSFGSANAAIEVPVGAGKFSFRQAGAPSHFFETEVFELIEDQVYTFALVGAEINEDQVLNLTDAAPQAETETETETL